MTSPDSTHYVPGAVSVLPVDQVRYVPELYPRLKPHDDVIERYRDALANLPPITVARDGVLVDGYHRWQAHRRSKSDTIEVENLGDLADAEILRESIRRNASHGQQLTRGDKQRMAAQMWPTLSHLKPGERVADLMSLLGVEERTVQAWTKDARKAEKEAAQAKAWDLWLNCQSQVQIADLLGFDQTTIGEWLGKTAELRKSLDPPESRQHFDVWQFATADRDAGAQSYFGAVPPQVLENLLWFYTEPGQIVVDLFAGSGTAIDVAKAMGRRVWASDISGNDYSPHLPIHTHDATTGWPEVAPRKADLVFLDPPYWQQATGRYSDQPNEFAEMDYPRFLTEWRKLLDECKAHLTERGRIAFIVSPTQLSDGIVVDHALDMAGEAILTGLSVERRIIVPYSTQQATGQQVTWARDNKRMLKLYRDLVVLR